MNPLQKKLRIQPDTKILVLFPPAGYEKTLGNLPENVSVTEKISGKHSFIHLFVRNKTELEKNISRCVKALAPEALFWISYPKGAKTDLTRDKGWECLEGLNMQWLALISFDENWSAFLMKNSPPKAQSPASINYQSASEEWVDVKTKAVRVPDDLKKLFGKNKNAEKIFEALSFTNRKEYVLWIVSAKREETRAERLARTIEKLKAGKKNPSEK